MKICQYSLQIYKTQKILEDTNNFSQNCKWEFTFVLPILTFWLTKLLPASVHLYDIWFNRFLQMANKCFHPLSLHSDFLLGDGVSILHLIAYSLTS